MTTNLILVDGGRGETRSEAIARRLRGGLAENNLSVNKLSKMLGVSQAKLSRRMTGEVAFDVNELDEICAVAGLSFIYITSGIKTAPPPSDDGGDGAYVRPKGFEPLTSWLGVRDQPTCDNVITLPDRRQVAIAKEIRTTARLLTPRKDFTNTLITAA